MFVVFLLHQTPKERPSCPSSHYPGKQKEMSGSISCGLSRLFQLRIMKGRWESMESTTEKTAERTRYAHFTAHMVDLENIHINEK